MKYVVIGLGAVGSIVGGLLTKSGEDVILIGKPYQIKSINKNGIKIIGFNGETIITNLHASTNLSAIKNIDVVFVCVKSQDTFELAHSLKNFLSKSTLIVSLQNGVRNAEILREITGNNVLSAVVLFNAVYSKPGEVILALKGGITLENDKKYRETLLKILNNADLKTIAVDDIESYLWSKLILNLQIAVTALTGQTIKESIVDKYSRKIIVEAMKEGIEIVEKSNIKLKTLPSVDPKKMIKRLSKSNTFILNIGSRFIGIKENARNSMWQSLSRGKPTEIDYINGEIVKLAEKNNLEAPINTKLVELIKETEKKHLTENFDPYELKKLLGI